MHDEEEAKISFLNWSKTQLQDWLMESEEGEEELWLNNCEFINFIHDFCHRKKKKKKKMIWWDRNRHFYRFDYGNEIKLIQ